MAAAEITKTAHRNHRLLRPNSELDEEKEKKLGSVPTQIDC
jgi:hypothetical protein